MQRKDDNPTSLKPRLAIFHNETQPMLSYYQRQHKLVTINADQPIDSVWSDVRRALDRKSVFAKWYK